MPIPTELEQWLADLAKEGELSAETVATLRTTFDASPKAAEYAKGSVLRQSDYSRLAAAAKTQQAALDAEKARLDTLLADTSTRSAAEESKYKQQVAAATARAQSYEQRFLKAQQKLRDEYQVQDDTLKDLGLDEVITQPLPQTIVPAAPGEADDRYVTRDKFGEFETAARTIYPQIPAMISDLNAEHIELFGKPMRGAVELVNEAIKTGRPMNELANERFGFDAKRQEMAAAARAQEIADAVKAAQVEWQSQAAMQQRGAITGLQQTGQATPGRGLAGVLSQNAPSPDNKLAQQQARVAAVAAHFAEQQAGIK